MIRLPPRFTRTDPLYPSTTPCRSADGYLDLADRVSNMIISGGVNIYPREVEDVLIGHPLVDDVAVIGVPDEEMGEAVRAVVQPPAGTDPASLVATGPELVEYCRGIGRASGRARV